MRKVYQSVVKFLKKIPWPVPVGIVLMAALILGALYYRAEAARQIAARQVVHTIVPGDSLSFTSLTYGVDLDDLRALNQMYGLEKPLLDRIVSAFKVPEPAPQVVEKTVEVEKVVEKTVEVVQTIDKGVSFQEVTGTRMVVYTVDMSIVVKDTQTALDQIERLTNEAGGYVVSAKTTQYEGGAYGNAVIRVPTAELDNVLAQLESLALEVRNQNKTGSDVTEEYVDLESRVKVLKAAEQELLELYQTRQADGEVTDILEVYRQLVSFREEIETLTGRMQYLEESAAMAKVTISVTPDALAQPVQIGRWRPDGTAREAVEVLVSSLQFLADMLIWGVILVLPLAILVGGAIFGIGRLIRRRRRQAKPKKEAPADANDKTVDGE